jgi:hypothetical protein
MPHDRPPSLMRALGLAVGDVWRTVTGAPPPAESPVRRQEVRREVEEQQADTPAGRVTLRRTTIEEVELHPRDPAPPR